MADVQVMQLVEHASQVMVASLAKKRLGQVT